MEKKQIKVFSNIYDIHFNDDVEEVHGAFGLHFPKNTKIYIQSGMPEHKEKVIILHELLHAIDLSLCLDLSEEKVHALSESICMLADVNFKFIEK